MKLCELLKDMPYVVSTRGDMNTEIREITSSSRDSWAQFSTELPELLELIAGLEKKETPEA